MEVAGLLPSRPLGRLGPNGQPPDAPNCPRREPTRHHAWVPEAGLPGLDDQFVRIVRITVENEVTAVDRR